MSFYSTALSGALSGVRTVARWLTGGPQITQPALPPPGTQHYNVTTSGNTGGPNGKKPNVQIINDWIGTRSVQSQARATSIGDKELGGVVPSGSVQRRQRAPQVGSSGTRTVPKGQPKQPQWVSREGTASRMNSATTAVMSLLGLVVNLPKSMVGFLPFGCVKRRDCTGPPSENKIQSCGLVDTKNSHCRLCPMCA